MQDGCSSDAVGLAFPTLFEAAPKYQLLRRQLLRCLVNRNAHFGEREVCECPVGVVGVHHVLNMVEEPWRNRVDLAQHHLGLRGRVVVLPGKAQVRLEGENGSRRLSRVRIELPGHDFPLCVELAQSNACTSKSTALYQGTPGAHSA
jgi:hypothetical protein